MNVSYIVNCIRICFLLRKNHTHIFFHSLWKYGNLFLWHISPDTLVAIIFPMRFAADSLLNAQYRISFLCICFSRAFTSRCAAMKIYRPFVLRSGLGGRYWLMIYTHGSAISPNAVALWNSGGDLIWSPYYTTCRCFSNQYRRNWRRIQWFVTRERLPFPAR
jgi:hypothetical protein